MAVVWYGMNDQGGITLEVCSDTSLKLNSLDILRGVCIILRCVREVLQSGRIAVVVFLLVNMGRLWFQGFNGDRAIA